MTSARRRDGPASVPSHEIVSPCATLGGEACIWWWHRAQQVVVIRLVLAPERPALHRFRRFVWAPCFATNTSHRRTAERMRRRHGKTHIRRRGPCAPWRQRRSNADEHIPVSPQRRTDREDRGSRFPCSVRIQFVCPDRETRRRTGPATRLRVLHRQA